MKKYPLMLSYITKTALWAGTKLKDDFGKKSDFDTVSESWELSVRKNEMATVENGVAKGLTLKEYFEAAGYDCVSPYFNSADRFPLLVKLIDAEDMLSVQVHPDDNYSSRVEGDSGKTEMWYIVDAKEGATLVYGLADGVSTEDFAAAVREGRIGEPYRTARLEVTVQNHRHFGVKNSASCESSSDGIIYQLCIYAGFFCEYHCLGNC